MAYGLMFGHGFTGQFMEGLSIVGEFIYLPGGLVHHDGGRIDGRQFNFTEVKIELDGKEIIVAYAGEKPSQDQILEAYEDAKEAYPLHFQ